MTAATVQTAPAYDETSVISTIVMAFSSDPAARWMYADSHLYLTQFPNFVKAFAGKAFEHNTVHTAGSCAAALWLPPDVHPDEDELVPLLQRTVPDEIKKDAFDMFEQMGRYHPAEPVWYLPLIGVDTPHQNRGYGSALLRHTLAICDREKIPAYLESTSPRNTALYLRHGFEAIGAIQAGSSPQIVPMLRKPRSAPASN